jgi:uncharacterized protein YndB with AHSA1/START domain
MASSGEQFAVREIENGKVEFTSRITVKGVSPDQIYQFLLSLDNDRYRQWHPGHHLEFRVVHQPKDETVGSVFYFKERFEDGQELGAQLKVVEAVPGERLVQRSISPWWKPFDIIAGLQSIPEGTLVTHQIVAGSDLPFLGMLFNLIMRRLFLKESNIKAIHSHANEEFTNLEHLLQEQ